MRDDLSNLIASLVRAANRTGGASASYASDLLYQAIIAITDLREQAGMPAIGTPRDGIVNLQKTAVGAVGVSPAEMRVALLDAADMLRTLRVVVDSGIELTLFETKAAGPGPGPNRI